MTIARTLLFVAAASALLPCLLPSPLAIAAPQSAAVPAAVAAAPHLAAPRDLRCVGRRDPLAVTESNPQFSWLLFAAGPNLHAVSQSAYEIQVAEDQSTLPGASPFNHALWTTGQTQSSSASAVPYAGPPLQPGRQYAWRVRVWDENAVPSGWSAPARWTQAPIWHAQWIGAAKDDPAGPLPLFRKAFRAESGVRRAMLYVTGLGQYEVRINGQKAGNDELTPGWTAYRRTIDYDAYDVTRLIARGDNAIGLMLGNGMYRVLQTEGRYTKFTGDYGPLRCIVQLHIEYAGGSALDIASDATWKTAPGPITFSSTYGGEDFNARLEPPGWDSVRFDDSRWQPVAIVDSPGGTLQPELAPPLRLIRTYSAKRPAEPKPGLLVYDLGQNFAGWPEIAVSGPAGAQIKIVCGELLNPDGAVSQRPSGEPQWFAYTLRGSGVERWHPRFSYYGFRYVQVEGASLIPGPGKAQIVSLRGDAIHSSAEPAGDFSSSSDLLNRIHTLILRAIENNSVSLFTDCPHREKLGWLEETHLLASAMLYDFDFAGIFSATARNIADAQAAGGPDQQPRPAGAPASPPGRIPEIAPQFVLFEPQWGIFDDSPEWGSAAVLAPWYLYQRTGDPAVLLEHYNVMKRYADYLATRASGGIIAYGLGDWYDIGPGEPGVSKLTTPGVTATAIHYQDLRALQQIATLLGKSGDAADFARRADTLRSQFNARFFDAAQHRYDKGSQTAQAMPLVVGLVPDSERAAVLEALVADIRAHRNHVTAGDIGYHYVVEALLDGTRSDVLLDMLERTDSPSYGYQLAQGATALTEAWDADPSSSQDHFMLGHAEEWFYRGLGGIDIDFARPADRRLILRPVVPQSMTSARASYRSVFGIVDSSWRRTPAETIYDFAIPANATAAVELNAASLAAVRVNSAPADGFPGRISTAAKDGKVEIVLGSGHYQVLVANASTVHSK